VGLSWGKGEGQGGGGEEEGSEGVFWGGVGGDGALRWGVCGCGARGLSCAYVLLARRCRVLTRWWLEVRLYMIGVG